MQDYVGENKFSVLENVNVTSVTVVFHKCAAALNTSKHHLEEVNLRMKICKTVRPEFVWSLFILAAE